MGNSDLMITYLGHEHEQNGQSNARGVMIREAATMG